MILFEATKPLGLDWSEGQGVDEYRKQHEQEWQPTVQELKAVELAERYHHETEAYDRTVCAGRVLDGSIMPMNHRELALVNGNARRVLAQIMAEAAAAGISAEDMRRSIGRHA
ncbi:MAG: hypothetical protein LW862_22390 [Rubrivivax sp.]|jgi:hypothetical protein|nr:hypothetical protein [Rubrivivax sp.]